MTTDPRARTISASNDLSSEVRHAKLQELQRLHAQIEQLETELGSSTPSWPVGYYAAYYATTGFMLGMFGAATSLLFNVIGSLALHEPQNPLHLIQVYLTFPLGAAALKMDTGLTLAIGCCLYLATGMLYGAIFNVLLTRFAPAASFLARLAWASLFSIVLWLVNFYGILSWLQPLLIGGNWIVELVPWWVAGLTHLVFAWTMVLVYPWGLYVPYKVETEQE